MIREAENRETMVLTVGGKKGGIIIEPANSNSLLHFSLWSCLSEIELSDWLQMFWVGTEGLYLLKHIFISSNLPFLYLHPSQTYIYFVQPSFSEPPPFSNIYLFRPTFLFCTSDLLKHIFISSNLSFLHLHPSQTYIYFVKPSFSAPPPFSNIYLFRPTFLFCTSDLLKHIFISSSFPLLHLDLLKLYSEGPSMKLLCTLSFNANSWWTLLYTCQKDKATATLCFKQWEKLRIFLEIIINLETSYFIIIYLLIRIKGTWPKIEKNREP